MQNKYLVWVFSAALCIFISCSKPKPEIPNGILQEKEMISVLADIHIAQAATAFYNVNDTLRPSMSDYIPYILKIHHVEQAVYDSSVSFYTLHPEIMQEMYNDVITELSRKQGEVMK